MHSSCSALGPLKLGARLALASVAALVATAVALTVGTPKAAADSYGCTWAPFGNVCILIEGSGLYVSHVRVRRAKIDWSLICNYQGRMVVKNRYGQVIDRRWSVRHAGCSVAWAWFDWYPRRTYPHGSRICTAFFENGELQGKPCNYVYRN
jgi:hypothetical protein